VRIVHSAGANQPGGKTVQGQKSRDSFELARTTTSASIVATSTHCRFCCRRCHHFYYGITDSESTLSADDVCCILSQLL